MGSKIIKFVAGGGKTTYSKELLKRLPKGIYLSYNNSVVDEMKDCGFLAKTIDSFFGSFIINKFYGLIPIINNNSTFSYQKTETNNLSKGARNIVISCSGKLKNNKKEIVEVSLLTKNSDLHRMNKFTNSSFLKYIFGKEKLRITDSQRQGLVDFIIKNYRDELMLFIKYRFDYIIIDEAQDLKDYREKFAEMLYESNYEAYFLGDEYQNINGGGPWFENIEATCTNCYTYRCAEGVCLWIRDNLNIKINGKDSKGEYYKINRNDIMRYDDGKRVLLYISKFKSNRNIIENWRGETLTIKSAKGSTIDEDIVILGNKLSVKNMYTAITRTTKNVYSCATLNKSK